LNVNIASMKKSSWLPKTPPSQMLPIKCWELKTGNEELVACLHCTMWDEISTTPNNYMALD